MTNRAKASYVNVGFAADVLHVRVNSRVICKIESDIFLQ